jgi:short subunit fatty acids transporter
MRLRMCACKIVVIIEHFYLTMNLTVPLYNLLHLKVINIKIKDIMMSKNFVSHLFVINMTIINLYLDNYILSFFSKMKFEIEYILYFKQIYTVA